MGITADIAIILVAGFIGGLIAQRLKQPLLLGYLLAGIVVGPYTGGVTVVELHDIELLAEIGVALLLFAVGLEFSFGQLNDIRRVAFGGTPIQLILTILAGFGMALLLGWGWYAAVWWGACIALSSTMVILKTLMAQGSQGSLAGRMMVALLIVQDVAVVPLMIVLPVLRDLGDGIPTLLLAIAKATLFVGAMIYGGTRVIPWFLRRIAGWKSRELFLIAVTTIGLGIGYVTYLVGLSFAFGAFVAGMVLSESEYSHQALSDIIPLRDLFGLVFFVSIGMLLDPMFVAEHILQIAVLVLGVLVVKTLIFTGVVRAFGYSLTTAVTVGLGLFQIGEFSFVVARVGRGIDALNDEQFALLLATAIVTMMLTPLLFRASGPLTRWLQRFERHPLEGTSEALPALHDHIIVAGFGRVGRYTADVVRRLDIPIVVIDLDPAAVTQAKQLGIPVIYGDASSPIILEAAGVEHARLMVVTTPAAADTSQIAERVQAENSDLHIVVRAATLSQVRELYAHGIHEVVQPEFEAGLELVRQALLHYDISATAIQELSDSVRAERYQAFSTLHTDLALLQRMRKANHSLEIAWFVVPSSAQLTGHSIATSNIRQSTGATVVTLVRADGEVVTNPAPTTQLQADDMIAVLGTAEQRSQFAALLQ